MYSSTTLVGLAVALLSQQVTAIDRVRDATLDANLATAATQLDRLALLPGDDDWLFDFTVQQPFYNFAPGGVTNMNAATFPASKGNGMTMAMLNLGPCAMLPPHYHPRAANYVVAVLGNTTTYMFEENGARLVTEVLTPGKATIFPQASMHMMENTGCEPSQLVSALNSDDAGTQNIGNVFTNGFPSEMVNAAMGSDTADLSGRVVPIGTGTIWGRAECLARCGIDTSNSTSSRM